MKTKEKKALKFIEKLNKYSENFKYILRSPEDIKDNGIKVVCYYSNNGIDGNIKEIFWKWERIEFFMKN